MSDAALNVSGPIALPATDATVLARVINPALNDLPPMMTSDPARVMLLASGRQESGFEYRTQLGGPARGFWQFEVGGITGVMRHPRSADECRDWCELSHVVFAPSAIYRALAHDDGFAAGIARLLLWTDPRPLPVIGDEDTAWGCYVRNWRPGKPSRARWRDMYPIAVRTVSAP